MEKEILDEYGEYVELMRDSLNMEDHQRFVAIAETMLSEGMFLEVYKYASTQVKLVDALRDHITYNIENIYKPQELKIFELRQQNKQYEDALKSIVNIDGAFTDKEFNTSIALYLIDQIAQNALDKK